jgi:hypothetical protein
MPLRSILSEVKKTVMENYTGFYVKVLAKAPNALQERPLELLLSQVFSHARFHNTYDDIRARPFGIVVLVQAKSASKSAEPFTPFDDASPKRVKSRAILDDFPRKRPAASVRTGWP